MHKNEAIARVAESAMKQIYDIAQFAISRVNNEVCDVGLEPMAQTSFTEVVERANASLDALKQDAPRQTRKPRASKAQEVLEATPTSENDFVDATKEIEIVPEESPPIEGTTAIIEHDEGHDNPDFPNHDDDWFEEDVERGRQLCRKLLSKMVSKIGDKATREAIFNTTQKPRATDFDATDCMNFYRANRHHG